ncbi:hypothetical protein M2390_003232, partial [Mycetocola sp. BIGb0189]|nr:hypothetical protein [Mycetocola sp. BIGb0189]
MYGADFDTLGRPTRICDSKPASAKLRVKVSSP